MFGMPDLPYQNGEGCWFSSESLSSQLGIQEEVRISSLIKKMTVNNSVIIAGEGWVFSWKVYLKMLVVILKLFECVHKFLN